MSKSILFTDSANNRKFTFDGVKAVVIQDDGLVVVKGHDYVDNMSYIIRVQGSEYDTITITEDN